MVDVRFYKYVVNSQVFYKSKHTYALVNLKPLVPGHVLVVPLRTSVLRFADLTKEESYDYMDTLQLVHKFIISVYKADSLNIAIQDGPESGQSIPHLHTHLIPRFKSDGYGDSIHTKIERSDLEEGYKEFEDRKFAFGKSASMLVNIDVLRVARSEEVMRKEASWLAAELIKFTSESE
ncbi:HIT-like domain-containing protein [Scheffersomyces xylosifermentans]|uniref:HIT-like domain-containing protein n=1 Tax=Scheffersomyces xylosifermentans TaxID=1304137 RepID=UPI00315D96D7